MNTPTDAPKQYDFEAIGRTINGFEEMAIERAFGKSFRHLGDGTLAARAILFVQWCREGVKDKDAYRNAMLLGIEELESMFSNPEPEADEEDDPKAGSATD